MKKSVTVKKMKAVRKIKNPLKVDPKVATRNSIARIAKEHPSFKKDYTRMLEIASNASEIIQAKKVLQLEKVPEKRIKEIIEPMENKRKQFMYDFNKFVEHSIISQKEVSKRNLDLIVFARAQISLKSYNALRGKFLTELSSHMNKSK